jgi:hypothetical protein
MNEETRAHLDKINNVNASPELVAVIQHDEGTGETVLLLNNQTLETGEEVDYRGTKFPAVFAINDMGTVPDEIDHSVIDHYVSTDAWDPIAKTIVTTSEAVYGKKPGRTIVGADVFLSIGNLVIGQDPFYKGKGSHVVCEDVTLDRFAFTVPNTVWGFSPEPVAPYKPINE